MRIAVVGGRDFGNPAQYELMCSVLSNFGFDKEGNVIVSGGAKGADYLAKCFAEDASLEYKEWPAQWTKYGRNAGFKRNKQIVKDSDFVIAFWDGHSSGTQNTIQEAANLKKPTLIIYY